MAKTASLSTPNSFLLANRAEPVGKVGCPMISPVEGCDYIFGDSKETLGNYTRKGSTAA